MPDCQVAYLMSGPAHLPYLLVSLKALRQHYQGPVRVYAYPESIGIARKIANVFDADCLLWQPNWRGKNGQFIEKIRMSQQQTHCELSMYLDADTMVAAPLDGLFRMARGCELLATQFNDWTSNSGMPRRRVSRLLDRAVDQDAVHLAMNHAYPSPNGGIFVCRPRSTVLSRWLQWTLAVRDLFIADETVLHAIVAYYEVSGLVAVAVDGWNCSPKHKPETLPDDQVRIWHFHGDSNVRPEKSLKGHELWYPAFAECLADNTAEIQDWIDGIDNKHLAKLLRKS